MGYGFIGLYLRSTLMDKLFIFSMDWLILGGAVPPGSPSGPARPRRSKHQKTENERHGPRTRASWPARERPARVLRVTHSAFSLLPTPSPSPRTVLLPGYILKRSCSPFPLLPPGPSHQPASPGLQQHGPTWFLCFHVPPSVINLYSAARGIL